MRNGLEWTALLGSHAGSFAFASFVGSDDFLQQSVEGLIAVSAHQVPRKQLEVIFSLNDGLIDHIQFLIMHADSP